MCRHIHVCVPASNIHTPSCAPTKSSINLIVISTVDRINEYKKIKVELLYQGSSKGYSCSTDRAGSPLNRKTHGPSQPENKSVTHHSISLSEVECKVLLLKTPYPSDRTQRIQVGSDPKACSLRTRFHSTQRRWAGDRGREAIDSPAS